MKSGCLTSAFLAAHQSEMPPNNLFLRARHQRGQNQKWRHHSALSRSPQVGGNATSPLHSRGSPKRGGQNQNWWGPQVGGNATIPRNSRGSPKTRGTKSELDAYTLPSGRPTSGQKSCILVDPQQRGQSENKTKAKKNFPWCPRSRLYSCKLTPLGFEPRTLPLG